MENAGKKCYDVTGKDDPAEMNGWSKEGISEIVSAAVDDIAEIKLTEKGYFIYAYEVIYVA